MRRSSISRCIEGVAVARDKRLHHRVLGHIGLDQATPGDRFAARAPGHLMQELEGALGRARVGLCQAEIGVDHADQRQPRKVMALGDELRADDHIDLALLDLTQGLAQVGDAGREVAG